MFREEDKDSDSFSFFYLLVNIDGKITRKNQGIIKKFKIVVSSDSL